MTSKPAPLTGLVDFHVHAGPDTRPRLLSWLQLARDAAAAGLTGFVAKSHHVVTSDVAGLLREATSDLAVWGGITLNRSVGGINPEAVAAALALGGRVVWLPTHDAVDDAMPSIPVLDRRGRLRPEVVEVIQLVATARAVLCTGHLDQRAVLVVADYALRAGAKLVVTHPEHRVNEIDVAAQKELGTAGVVLERLVPRHHTVTDLSGIAARIREVGVESSILGSDLGQPDQPHPVDGFSAFVEGLAAHGFTREEIVHMARTLPLELLEADGGGAVQP